jgi:phosphatidylserine/phosphatidylglycerophosphate/cardiolipin synthase-like enzyme
MTQALFRIPESLRRRLVKAFETGSLPIPCSVAAVRSATGSSEAVDAIVELVEDLAGKGITGKAAGAWVRAVEEASQAQRSPDLVWSGPEVPGLHARDTRQVYQQLLSSATRSVWASTYVYFDGPEAFAVIARRMDEVPTLQVRLLMNVQRKWGDTTAANSLVRKFADQFWGHDWPGTRRPEVFYDPRSLEMGGPAGVLHAKAVVADDESVFITSANLTEAALDRNIEMGLLMRDRALAASVVLHFRTLVEKGLLTALPAA